MIPAALYRASAAESQQTMSVIVPSSASVIRRQRNPDWRRRW